MASPEAIFVPIGDGGPRGHFVPIWDRPAANVPRQHTPSHLARHVLTARAGTRSRSVHFWPTAACSVHFRPSNRVKRWPEVHSTAADWPKVHRTRNRHRTLLQSMFLEGDEMGDHHRKGGQTHRGGLSPQRTFCPLPPPSPERTKCPLAPPSPMGTTPVGDVGKKCLSPFSHPQVEYSVSARAPGGRAASSSSAVWQNHGTT